MSSVAIIAHSKKSFGGGLSELRRELSKRGINHPIWYEADKSRKTPDHARRAVKEGATLLLLWGGDGTVQRCLDAVADEDVTVGVLPAGTANLLATNLGIPRSMQASLDIALGGHCRSLDLGVINAEHFAVMAGAGFDSLMMKKANSGLKKRLGRLTYVWTGASAAQFKPVRMRIKVDGSIWFTGGVSCLLLGNMGRLTGGINVFPNALPDDGLLEIGVVTASNLPQWARVIGRLVTGDAARSNLVRTTRGQEIRVKLDRAIPYELDGGARSKVDRIDVRIRHKAIRVCVPEERIVSLGNGRC